MIRIGCSGWSYAHWRNVLYPASGTTASWLSVYAESFDTVEINSTFYRLPRAEVVARWAASTPERFCFAVKTNRYLTHVKRLREAGDGVARLGEPIAPLRAAGKLGPVLWQLPARFRRDDERLASALSALSPGRHAFEFRHASWFDDEVYALLRRHGAALVVADRAPDPPTPWVDTAGWVYVRFHSAVARTGTTQHESFGPISRAPPGDVYAYFNNDWEGFAIENARALRSFLGTDSR